MTAGQADLAVGPAPAGWAGPVRDLGVEEFVVVVPQDDPVEDENGTIALNQLQDRDWVHYAPSNGLADILNRHCAAAGFQPRAAVRTEQTAAAPVLAAAGLGPALVPSNVLSPHFDGRVLRPEPRILRTLTAYTRDETRPDRRRLHRDSQGQRQNPLDQGSASRTQLLGLSRSVASAGRLVRLAGWFLGWLLPWSLRLSSRCLRGFRIRGLRLGVFAEQLFQPAVADPRRNARPVRWRSRIATSNCSAFSCRGEPFSPPTLPNAFTASWRASASSRVS